MSKNSIAFGDKVAMLEMFEELQRRANQRGGLNSLFPEEGPCSYDKYPKQMQFFTLGGSKRERIFMAANRVGKTIAGAFELSVHATGMYPDWWTGKRFEGPISAWYAGDTGQTTRDIMQKELLGDPIGTGMIPLDMILMDTITNRPGVPGAIEKCYVKHVSGGSSFIGAKSYDQGRRAFQGTAKHVVWLDEEAPLDVYNECLIRTMTTGGIVYVTFTPMLGLTEFVQHFMKAAHKDDKEFGSKAIVMAGWDDVPHLGAEEKIEMLAATPDYLKDSRSKGIPGLGSGAVYPIPESEIMVSPMPIPPHWRRFYGLDVGWKYTGAVFCAHDSDRDIVYIYDVYKRSAKEIDLHAAAIKKRYVHGVPIVGAIDPASRQRGQADGQQLLKLYRNEGLKLVPADNAVSAGTDEVMSRLSTGRLKVFYGLSDWMDEYRIYRRDEKGRIVKEADHLMDATRYAIMTGIRHGKPVQKPVSKGVNGVRYF